MKEVKAFENIEQMVKDDLSMGDIVIMDNLFVEFHRGCSLEDLAVKYCNTVAGIKGLLQKAGVKFDEE